MLDGRPRATQLTFDEVAVADVPSQPPRPRVYLQVADVPPTRGDCEGDSGVCLALRCRYNTTIDITSRGGLRINSPGNSKPEHALVRLRRRGCGSRSEVDGFVRNDAFDDCVVEAIERTGRNCALDEVDAHPDGMSLESIAGVMATTEARIRQIEESALSKLRHECDLAGISFADFVGAWLRT